MAGMESLPSDVAAEIERIADLPPAERAGALEALEARLRASIDDIAGA